MASIEPIDSVTAANVPDLVASRPPATASADLAKLESQLSDWVHCDSSKTSAGKAKIAEISDKIEAIKVQVKKADEAHGVAAPSSPALEAQRLRFDGVGAWLNEQA